MWFSKHPQRKIRNFLIYPRFQLSLVFTQTLLLTVLYLFARWGVDTAFEKLHASGVTSGFNANHPYFAFVAAQKNMVMQYFTTAVIACAVLYAVVSIVLSHRLAGPLVRLRTIFHRIGDQGWDGIESIRFRQGDFFQDLPPEINRAFQRLSQDAGRSPQNLPPVFDPNIDPNMDRKAG